MLQSQTICNKCLSHGIYIKMKEIKKIVEDIVGGQTEFYDHDETKYKSIKQDIPDEMFFHAISVIVGGYGSATELYKNLTPNGLTLDERGEKFEEVFDLLGIERSLVGWDVDSLGSRVMWTAYDNFTGIKEGTISSFGDLKLSKLKTYKVNSSIYEEKTVAHYWSVEVEAYDKYDASTSVEYDDSGLNAYYEHMGTEDYYSEYIDGTTYEYSLSSVQEVGSGRLDESLWVDEPTDKWGLLEKDIREVMEVIIKDHSPKWRSQYEVMGAIEEIMEGLFQKVGIREGVSNDRLMSFFEEYGDLLQYVKGETRNTLVDYVEGLRRWGGYNMLTTNLGPFLTDGREALKDEFSSEIMRWVVENESYPPDYDEYFKTKGDKVQYLWDNAQKVRDAMTRVTMLYLEGEGEDLGMSSINDKFFKLGEVVYRFILKGPGFIEDAQERIKKIDDMDDLDMGEIMYDTPERLGEQYNKGDDEEPFWFLGYNSVEIDFTDRGEYINTLLTMMNSDLDERVSEWENYGNDDELESLIITNFYEVVDELVENDEIKLSEMVLEIIDPLNKHIEESKSFYLEHRKQLLGTIKSFRNMFELFSVRE